MNGDYNSLGDCVYPSALGGGGGEGGLGLREANGYIKTTVGAGRNVDSSLPFHPLHNYQWQLWSKSSRTLGLLALGSWVSVFTFVVLLAIDVFFGQT